MILAQLFRRRLTHDFQQVFSVFGSYGVLIVQRLVGELLHAPRVLKQQVQLLQPLRRHDGQLMREGVADFRLHLQDAVAGRNEVPAWDRFVRTEAGS